MQLDILQNNVEGGAVISLYRCGPMVDLCRGPHVPSTSFVKACAVTNASRAFWRGDTSAAPLQRVYGVSFPDKKLLKGAQAAPRANLVCMLVNLCLSSLLSRSAYLLQPCVCIYALVDIQHSGLLTQLTHAQPALTQQYGCRVPDADRGGKEA